LVEEDEFRNKPEIKIVIPDVLKVKLVDDWEAITKNAQVSAYESSNTWQMLVSPRPAMAVCPSTQAAGADSLLSPSLHASSPIISCPHTAHPSPTHTKRPPNPRRLPHLRHLLLQFHLHKFAPTHIKKYKSNTRSNFRSKNIF